MSEGQVQQKSWYGYGDEEAKKEKEEKARRRASGSEFFLKPGESRKVMFLGDVKSAKGEATNFSYWRHRLKVDGCWPPVDVVCTRGVTEGLPFPPFVPGVCAVCQHRWKDGNGKTMEFRRDHIKLVHLADLTPYQNPNDGKTSFAQIRLLFMKQTLFERLVGKADKRREQGDVDGMKMWVFDVTRIREVKGEGGNDVSWTTGNDFEPVVKIENPFAPLPKVMLRDKTGAVVGQHPGLFTYDNKPLDIAAPDYRKIIVPTPPPEIEELFRSHVITDGTAGRGKGGDQSAGSSGVDASAHKPVSY